MYTLFEIENNGLNYLELISSNGKSKAQICLNQGGRLSYLLFNNIQILADYNSDSYKNNYASSILFPFANRIKNGEYTFNNFKYQLDCNETKKNNAIHGLVFDKTFVCLNTTVASDFASATLEYKNEGNIKGFPFKFSIELTYILSAKGLNLSVKIINTDEKDFPFTLGWHPYFKSEDLNSSSIHFNCNTKYVCDKQNIITNTTNFNSQMPFQLKDIKLDDGYQLESNKVKFFTPAYNLKLTSTSKDNFLQLYTPNQPNVIAIEPMTGVADSFNNHMGLQKLHSKASYTLKWSLTIETKETMQTNN